MSIGVSIDTLQTAFRAIQPEGVVIRFLTPCVDGGIDVMVTTQCYAQSHIDGNTLNQTTSVEATANLMENVVTMNILELKEQLLKVVAAIDEWKPS